MNWAYKSCGWRRLRGTVGDEDHGRAQVDVRRACLRSRTFDRTMVSVVVLEIGAKRALYTEHYPYGS